MRILADTATTDRPLIFVLIRANEQFSIVPFDENLVGPALSGDMQQYCHQQKAESPIYPMS